MTFPPLNRHQVREKALQAIFQLKSNDELDKETAIRMARLSEQEDLNEDEELPNESYLNELVNGVIEKQEEINEQIRPYLKKWTFERLPRTDGIILQLAVYEMVFVEESEVPSKVALNEAIELAKEYCDESSRKFINGVLSNLMSNIENP
ncbi:transcription antitermination factor NusB [Jeotgalibaca ciconiae]|uniref:Transcription antitermination protein NusB n=1 Tax=Jeotgalibaca ciconiae TaxID=2496265 RepID=A0A3Q9BLY5_9LACT|nr:transcription antitermination factor NusB [Jeotgalibaca ciconiae]AZP05497.1 transcription antitermination factor NusB [Jeotgalibaca ciconiae]HJB23682.1 transcription antitermination factor NusB [Candidatus Jeotgalibaca pullicola]